MTHLQACQDFFQSRHSLVLSTRAQDGSIETSVAPFVPFEDNLYIFVSELASHTANILQVIQQNKIVSTATSPGLVSLLLVADEVQTEQMFARERITLQALPSEIVRQDALFAAIMACFAQRFGEVVGVLQGLPDFHLLQLQPISGGYVKGFGQAFKIPAWPCEQLAPIGRN